jgi:adenylate cyclase class 2
MSENRTEIEIKVHVNDLGRIEKRLLELGAMLLHPRQPEINLRFDTPERSLASKAQVLRLRQDDQARLTFKGQGTAQDGVRIRQELEFTVSDFDAARLLLEALGFQVYTAYEKYRTTYQFKGCEIVLDELPYGSFYEIEGPDVETVQAVNSDLGLRWGAGVALSYTELFQQLRRVYGWEFNDLTFENFAGVAFDLAAVGVKPADKDVG